MTMIGGTTEGEVLRMLQDCHEKAEGCCRQMAHLRGDTRWLALARVFAGLSQKVKVLDRATGLRSKVILPAGYDRPNWH